jgi:hypothetical protein
VSALLGYRFGRQHSFEEKRERRADLATALLIELSHIESTLRDMYSQERPLDYRWYLPLPWFEKLFPDTRTFTPATTQAAYQFFGLVLEIESRMAGAREYKEITATDQWTIRAKAGSAVQRLALLAIALRKEGGSLPPIDNMQHFEKGQLPELPPPSFPHLNFPNPDG